MTLNLFLLILATNLMFVAIQWVDDGCPHPRDLSPGFWVASSAVTLLTWGVLLSLSLDSTAAKAVVIWVALVAVILIWRPWTRDPIAYQEVDVAAVQTNLSQQTPEVVHQWAGRTWVPQASIWNENLEGFVVPGPDGTGGLLLAADGTLIRPLAEEEGVFS